MKNCEEWKKIGSWLKGERKELNLSIRELAKNIGVSKSTIYKFESSKPILRAKLVEKAYYYFLYWYEIKLEEEREEDRKETWREECLYG